MSLFTVAIPTHNRAEYLAYTISCLQQQTFTDFELLISDNASTDNTPEVIERFTDQRIRYVRQNKKLDLHQHFIACADLAHGDWLVFNQDDDVLCPYFLERCANAIRKHPDIVMYATEVAIKRDVRTLYPTATISFPLHHHWDRPQPRLIPGAQVAALNMFITNFHPPAQAFPTNLFRRLALRNSDGEQLADRYWTWRIACEGTVAFEGYIGAILAVHEAQYTKTPKKEWWNAFNSRNAAMVVDHCERNGLDWQSALRTLLPELPREFRQERIASEILNPGIPDAAFEIFAEDFAHEEGVSPAEYVTKCRQLKLESLKPAPECAPNPTPVPAAAAPRGRLDRLGLPKPMIRVIRKFLALFGKKYD